MQVSYTPSNLDNIYVELKKIDFFKIKPFPILHTRFFWLALSGARKMLRHYEKLFKHSQVTPHLKDNYV